MKFLPVEGCGKRLVEKVKSPTLSQSARQGGQTAAAHRSRMLLSDYKKKLRGDGSLLGSMSVMGWLQHSTSPLQNLIKIVLRNFPQS